MPVVAGIGMGRGEVNACPIDPWRLFGFPEGWVVPVGVDDSSRGRKIIGCMTVTLAVLVGKRGLGVEAAAPGGTVSVGPTFGAAVGVWVGVQVGKIVPPMEVGVEPKTQLRVAVMVRDGSSVSDGKAVSVGPSVSVGYGVPVGTPAVLVGAADVLVGGADVLVGGTGVSTGFGV